MPVPAEPKRELVIAAIVVQHKTPDCDGTVKLLLARCYGIKRVVAECTTCGFIHTTNIR